jgi:phosphoglucosamine mutase
MDKRRYFGTDGIRGRVGDNPMTVEFVMKLGWAAGRVLTRNGETRVVIGKDTRISGYMFESALEAGLSAAGVDIMLLGPMPTPGIAYLAHTLRASAGIVISASHNPFDDNGIKFFDGYGAKLPDETELAIEEMMAEPMITVESRFLGKASRIDDGRGRYIEFCKRTIPSRATLRGLTLVVDCANGATYNTAPDVFRELGAQVITIGDEPDGLNINADCGALYPEAMREHVLRHGADAGIALDGDGDRVIMMDAAGEVVDGDEILYIIAKAGRDSGRLKGGVVGTLMSNLGLEHALARDGIPFCRAPVGDRYVMEGLRDQGWHLGGENSGHIIYLARTTTGDGIVAALQVLHVMAKQGRSLAELKSGMSKYPQVLLNVRVATRPDLSQYPEVQAEVRAVEEELGGRGRVLLRPSGTEPLVRVMVEAEEGLPVQQLAERIAACVDHARSVR